MPPSAEMRTSLGQHSMVSVGLVITLVVGAAFYGRQLQRLDGIEIEMRELSQEVREMRSSLRTSTLGR